ncbi:uncharacterized protein M421DRAFT_91306 [Didymella exigua CBS 183.55]|uniref:Uncharacterized protein n=1 Tax=Didymella exigua CBS 183.55 TaxID=1150837 RepID=A0A6A5RT19_9PLEO|nr:uncharacterized protein M421DRAFT_91306 [Didymella exigua CBS 183.55]KAF1930128.1 hypothetical protein M421DRAFT_91306 [Didymella exigua CBS 183.55]
MCHTEHVYHRACSHWGRERIVGEPCCRARTASGRHTTCLYTENIGSVNSSDPCSQCIYQLARGDDWKPFEHVSNAAWARVEERLRQRRLAMSQTALHLDGTLETPPIDVACSSVLQVDIDGKVVGRTGTVCNDCGVVYVDVHITLQQVRCFSSTIKSAALSETALDYNFTNQHIIHSLWMHMQSEEIRRRGEVAEDEGNALFLERQAAKVTCYDRLLSHDHHIQYQQASPVNDCE